MRFRIMPLEERIVLDAAGIFDILHSYQIDSSLAHAQGDIGAKIGAVPAVSDNSHDKTLSLDANAASTTSGIHVLVISSGIHDPSVLAAAAKDPAHVVYYDPAHTSLEQLSQDIASVLHGQQADSIAFVNEGKPGQFSLTQDVSVSMATLQSSAGLQTFWHDVGTMVRDGGHVDLLACDVAANAQGVDAVNDIDHLVDASGKHIQVDASTDLTGNASSGGNWQLELGGVNAAPIYFNVAALSHWDSILGNPVAFDLPLPAGAQVDNTLGGAMASVNGITYFVATDSTHGTQIWATDGNQNGASVVTNFSQGTIGNLTAFNGALYFSVDIQAAHGISASAQLYEISGSTVTAVGPAFQAIGDSGVGFLGQLPQTAPFFTENNSLYFVGQTAAQGAEPYVVTDGTTVSLLMDINPGSGSSEASNFAVLDPTATTPLVVFSANDGVDGQQLWVTNGTGASMITDSNVSNGGINPGSPNVTSDLSYLGFLTEFTLGFQTEIASLGNNLDVFTANVGTSSAPDMQIWVTDGTTANTSEIADLGSDAVISMAAVNGKAIFSTDTDTWSTDGTSAGTSMIANGVVDVGNAAFNNELYFIGANSAGTNTSLYATDGTAAGTTLVSGSQVFTIPDNIALAAIGNSLFFSANDGVNGTQLWESNGSSVVLASDIAPGSASDPNNFVSNGQAVLFDVVNTTDGGLWTAGNSIQLNDQSYIAPENGTLSENAANGLLNGAQDVNGEALQVTPETSATANGSVTINADGSFSYTPDAGYLGPDIFSYQVTNTDGTVRIATASLNVEFINQAPSFTVPATTTVVESSINEPVTVSGFATNISVGSGDPVTETVQFNVLNDDNPALFTVAPSIDASGNLTYTLAADESGTANITVDAQNSGGTANGGNDTSASQSFAVNAAVNQPPSFTLPNPDISVAENSGDHASTQFATNISPGVAGAGETVNFVISGDSNPSLFSVAPSIDSSGTLTYMLASGETGTANLSVYAQNNGGTADGGVDTSSVQNFTIATTPPTTPPAAVYDLPLPADVQVDANANMVTVNGLTYFVASDPVHGEQVWKTDGNLNGTSMVTDLPTLTIGNLTIGNLTAFNGALYFSVSTPGESSQLYELNDTTATAIGSLSLTNMGSSETPGFFSTENFSQTGPFFTENNLLYFVGQSNALGTQVYTSDGTTVSQLTDINPSGGGLSQASGFTVVNPNAGTPLVVFTASNSGSDGLWVTDGTAANTSQLDPGAFSNPGDSFVDLPFSVGGVGVPTITNQPEIVSVGNFAVFTALLDTDGDLTLWRTDGTTAGTSEIMDFGNNGEALGMIALNGKAIFSAFTVGGVAIWSSDGTAAGTEAIYNNLFTESFTSFNGEVYFMGSDANNDTALYATDGTAAGTIAVSGDIFILATSSSVTSPVTQPLEQMAVIGNSLFFAANDDINGTQLWQTYGRDSGVTLAQVIVPGGTSSNPENFVSNGQALLFDVVNTSDGGLWTAGNSIQLNDQSYNAPENFAGASALPLTGNLLNGAQDVNGESLSVTSHSTPADGSLTVNPDGSFSYTANVGYLGPDSFSYQVTNTDGMVRTATASLNVEFVNQAPSFTVPATTTVVESSINEPVTVSGFATNISVGSGDPVTETVQFNVLNDDNPALFTVAPSIDASGNLTYTLAADESGTANITVDAQNSGGTANGGNDTSASQSFAVNAAVNQPPSFTLPNPDISVAENSGDHASTQFATNISPGVAGAGETVNFVISGDSNPSLFSVAPSIDSSGTLTYMLASGETGTANLSVYAQNNGGTADGGVDTSSVQNFTIATTPPTTPPAAVYDLPLPADVQVDANANMVTVNGLTYFVASDPVHGEQVWKTDGNLNGTSMVTDLPTLTIGNLTIGNLTAFNGALYFSVSTPGESSQLYELNDTTATAIGSLSLTNMGSSETPGFFSTENFSQTGPFFTENNLLYFVGQSNALGTQVYTSDGTTVSQLTDINPSGGGLSQASGFTVVNPNAGTPLVVFTASNSGSDGLWVTDGTAANTSQLDPGAFSNPGDSFVDLPFSVGGVGVPTITNQPEIVSVGNFAVFTALLDTDGDLTLWRTDGTTAGTSEIMDFGNNGEALGMIALNGKAIFSAFTVGGVAIWSSDGTAAGTEAIYNNLFTESFTSFNGEVYFMGSDANNDTALYATDGTAAGTIAVSGDIFILATSSSVTSPVTQPLEQMAVIGNSLFFAANDDINGTQLWQTYGRDSGVTLAQVIVPGGTSSNPENFVSNGQALLFDVSNTTDGGLWTAGNSIQLNDQSYVAPENFAGEQALPLTGNLLNGAQDVNGESLSVTSHSTPADGSLTVNPDGSFSYTANAGYLGPDSFSYQVTNTDGTVRTGTVSLNVEFVNQAPSFTEGANQSVPENSGAETVNGFVTNISPGAGDPGNETVGIASVTNDNNALFSVQPAIDTSGNLTYTVSGAVNSPSVETTVTVEAQNSGGTANGGHNTTSETFTITVNDVGPSNISLSNSTVADNASNNTVVGNLSANDPIASNNHYVITADPLGALGVSGNQVVVSNSAHLAGHTSDTITIQDTDLAGESYTKSFTITIQTEPPVANNDAYNDFHLSANAATITESAAQGVLANDTDSNGLALTAQLLTAPSDAVKGSFSFNADGSFSYTAKSGFSGVDSFTYKDSDGLFSSNTATVSINVDIIPVISGVPATGTFVEGQAPVILSPSSSATHSTGYANSDLVVSLLNNGSSADVLSITTTSTITLSGSNVLYSGTDIGSYSGGTDLNPLVVTFNSSATNASVGKVMDAIAFSNNSSSPSALSRTVQFQLTDSAGDSSSPLSTVVSMVDDVPTIGATSTNLNIVTGTTSHVGSLSGLTLNDTDTSGIYDVSVQVQKGTLNFTSLTGLSLTFLNGTEPGSTTIDFQGTLAHINTALSRLTYTSNAGYMGSDEIAVNVTDGVTNITADQAQDTIFLNIT